MNGMLKPHHLIRLNRLKEKPIRHIRLVLIVFYRQTHSFIKEIYNHYMLLTGTVEKR